MKWTGLNDLREMFLSFFESKGHLRLPSFSLIPQNDKSLLLINSGMAPMKKYFTGEETPPRKRVTTCQKCIRTPDIERVGKTARHGTFFEMLGNFSFGDYFKKEACSWAWEFFTKVLEIPTDRLWVSIYQDDDEAFEIWTRVVGVEPERIVRFGKEDNFWEHGSGPCGPCSEIYFDRGESRGCGKPDCAVGCDCDRFVEVWNLVFTQFDSDGKGNYTPLANPNIDTGMGLERLACVMQDVDNLFMVDTVRRIIDEVSKISGKAYGQDSQSDVSIRVITDHIRSTTFMVCDGVLPSNEGRGYVLRRLLRRAARHGRLLGIKGTFLSDLCDLVIDDYKCAYPELEVRREFIKKVLRVEEESFARTIDQGLVLLNEMIEALEGNVLSGQDAFKLYDTFGFPIDLTREILAEKGIGVDEEGFTALMKEQRERARNARKASDGEAWAGQADIFEDFPATEFLGYEKMAAKARVIGIFAGGEFVDSAGEGDKATLILDATTFYGESGGQVGDIGVIEWKSGDFAVGNTRKTAKGVFMHEGTVKAGVLQVGDEVEAKVDTVRRYAIMRNHTAAHLLQAALRNRIGKHVEQAGQLVNEKFVRFDFTHFSALTEEEIRDIEKEINDVILSAIDVARINTSLDEARKMGAMALFGEKYGETVCVIKVGDYSMELCGGTHIDNTGKIGLFKVISEGSVASGVRRIEAVTGQGVLDYLNGCLEILENCAAELKVNNISDIPIKVKQQCADIKQLEKEIDSLNDKLAVGEFNKLLDSAKEVKGVKLISAKFSNMSSDTLRKLCDMGKTREDLVTVLASVSEGKVTFCASCGTVAVTRGAHAGNIVRQIASIAGGSGGGRPDSAMAGGKDPSLADKALSQAENIIENMLSY